MKPIIARHIRKASDMNNNFYVLSWVTTKLTLFRNVSRTLLTSRYFFLKLLKIIWLFIFCWIIKQFTLNIIYQHCVIFFCFFYSFEMFSANFDHLFYHDKCASVKVWDTHFKEWFGTGVGQEWASVSIASK